MGKKTRAAMVDLALSWLGKNEADSSFRTIIDIYNGYDGTLPRGVKMSYSWPWCACTWSALAIKLGYTSIVPIEISCHYLIERAKDMGIWIEADNRVPKLAEAVLYNWDDGVNYATTDNTGEPDHVGVAVEVNESAGQFVVVEGNYSNAVKKRTMSINGRYIRGFISPKYDEDGIVSTPTQAPGKSIETVAREVIAGTWGNGDARKKALANAGYDCALVQAKVNVLLNGGVSNVSTSTSSSNANTTNTASGSVTATDYATKKDASLAGTYKVNASGGLYLRHGAGKNKKAMVLIPNGTKAECYGYYSMSGSDKWLYVRVTIGGVKYTGFSHSGYLKKQ